MSQLFFCERFRTSCCISRTIFKKPTILTENVSFLKIVGEIQHTTTSTETFTENLLRHNFALHFTSYLSIALSKILPHSKTIKNAKKLSVFGENDSRRLSNFLQTHIFWKFDHISRTYNQINYRNIWFAKVAIILIMMHVKYKCLFDIFFEKIPHHNAVEQSRGNKNRLKTYIFTYNIW